MLKGPKRSFLLFLLLIFLVEFLAFFLEETFFYYNLEIDFLMIVAVFEAAQNQHWNNVR